MNKLFYFLKPIIPRALQIFLRRILVIRKLQKYKSVWPIMPGSEKKPVGWKGWPGDKKFAFVLTHDVELQNGHDLSLFLADIEQELGFVSSFNFVPKRYNVASNIRKQIEEKGFEVGVHGLYHDGKLFQNKKIFEQRAVEINKYINEWDAKGFRAPAMHHDLESIGKLEIEYDLSTFDTDPFEPQADGVGTIFPFWVGSKNRNGGYVEMPYTLVQDFTLFILMRQVSPNIWYKKTKWIVEHGGMVLVNVHPDYIDFNNQSSLEKFPVRLYIDFLKHIKENYSGLYWNPTPAKLADYYKEVYQK